MSHLFAWPIASLPGQCRLTTMNNDKAYAVKSSNFSWHAPVPAGTYVEALTTAKARGWEARIELADGTLVAVWSPLYGTTVYARALAR